MVQTTILLENLLKTRTRFIFLGGVHGVGKTTVCDRMFTQAGFRCVTASSLIEAYGIRVDQNKQVESVADNQLALIEQLYFEKQHHARLLLDGHYCLINSTDEIESIDVDIFRQMSPDACILLKDYPSKISIRLKNRDGKNWNRLFIEKFQKREEQHAQYIANKLSVPLYIISN